MYVTVCGLLSLLDESLRDTVAVNIFLNYYIVFYLVLLFVFILSLNEAPSLLKASLVLPIVDLWASSNSHLISFKQICLYSSHLPRITSHQNH